MSRERPRIGHVIDSLGLSGGTEKNLISNLKEFDRERISHEVIVLHRDPDSRIAEVPEGVRVRFLFDDEGSITRLGAVKRLLALTGSEEFDLLHASLPLAAIAARITGMIRRPKVVESLVNISHEPIRCVDNPHVTRPKLLYHTLLDGITMRGVDAFHAVSQEVADSWARVVRIPRSRITVIPRGVDISSIVTRSALTGPDRATIRADIGVGEDSFLVVNVGRHEAQKGQRYFIEAAVEARKSVPGLQAVIVGREGNLSGALNALIDALGARDFVHLVGSRRDVHQIMAASDVFVFPSLFEGNGGNAMLEAMAVGLPIVTTNAAPMTDLIPDDRFGILCGRTDSTAIASAIVGLFSDELLRTRLGESARERAIGLPDASTVAARFEKMYEDLLAR